MTIKFKLENGTLFYMWDNYHGVVPVKGDFVDLGAIGCVVTSRKLQERPESIVTCTVRVATGDDFKE